MKKVLVLLLSGLFLYGCGSGGVTSTSSNGSNPSSTPVGGTQPDAGLAKVFTLTIVDSAKVTAKTVSGTLPTATDVRVVIRKFDTVTTINPAYYYYDYEGIRIDVPATTTDSIIEIYKSIQDVPYNSAGTVQIEIPEGTGYTLDVMTSKWEPGIDPIPGKHSLLKYGHAIGVDVGISNTGAVITMNTINDLLNMTVADTVSSTLNFNVTLNNVLPLAPSYKMTMSLSGITPIVKDSSTSTCTFTAPKSYSAGTVSLQGQFTLNKTFLKENEKQADWTRIFPNADYFEEVSSQLGPLWLVTVPNG